MKSTTNTNTNTTSELKVIGKPFAFVINNDEQTEKTDTACQAFREWIKTPQGSRKYIDKYGIIAGGWCIDIADVINFIHVATAQDALTGGIVDVIYLIFKNELLNRFVYIDGAIRQRGSILLPIDGKIEYVQFDFKYTTARKKTPTKKTMATDTTKTPTKTQTKTQTKTSKKVVAN